LQQVLNHLLAFIKIDKERIITSTSVVKKKCQAPIIIGGGVIGIELGWHLQLRCSEYMDRIIPGMDSSLSKELTKVLKKQGMKFYACIK
jgi:dihydrolipoamide dehydrogenase